MNYDEVFKITVRQHNAQKIAIKQLKIKSIHKDIIRLKQENRNLSAKRDGMLRSVHYWVQKEDENFDDTRLRNCNEARINDLGWMLVLIHDKIEVNSKLINKHRAKCRELRSELQELKKELSVLKGEKE